MKKTIFLSILTLALIAGVFYACEKEKITTPQNNTTSCVSGTSSSNDIQAEEGFVEVARINGDNVELLMPEEKLKKGLEKLYDYLLPNDKPHKIITLTVKKEFVEMEMVSKRKDTSFPPEGNHSFTTGIPFAEKIRGGGGGGVVGFLPNWKFPVRCNRCCCNQCILKFGAKNEVYCNCKSGCATYCTDNQCNHCTLCTSDYLPPLPPDTKAFFEPI